MLSSSPWSAADAGVESCEIEILEQFNGDVSALKLPYRHQAKARKRETNPLPSTLGNVAHRHLHLCREASFLTSKQHRTHHTD